MPHAKFDDNFADHGKVAALSDAAFRLHVSGILYCSRHQSDGLISADDVPRLVRRFRRATLAELVDRGLWISVLDGAYTIHDYLDWNDSRAIITERREKAAQRKADWIARHATEEGK